MKNLKINLVAFPGATVDIINKGESIIKKLLPNLKIEISDKNPDALFIISGGSESKARDLLQKSKRILLLAMTENNSYAAASEIKSYCNQNNINSVLYNIDYEKDIQTKIDYYLITNKVLNTLSNYKIGLIGKVSEWLINSNIESDVLKDKFGIELEQIAWEDYSKYSDYSTDNDFINHFNKSNFNLEDSSKVYNLLQDIVKQKQLNAITVECFPLVRQNAVTACLALSKLNTDHFPSGCEGDLTSIAGKVIIKELTGQVPWMANLAAIDEDKVFFAHCTIATNLISNYEIKTHFETGEGTAIQGKFKSEVVTIFRLNKELSKAFLSYGRIVERPERNDSCRTQIIVEIPTEEAVKLKENPLGNHHIIIPGDHRELLKYFFNITHINLI